MFTVGINHAVTLLAERKERGPRMKRGGQALKELGAHPQSGAAVKVMKGRFGPYVTDGKLNATLPRGSEPEAMTMDEAVQISERNAFAVRLQQTSVEKDRQAIVVALSALGPTVGISPVFTQYGTTVETTLAPDTPPVILSPFSGTTATGTIGLPIDI